MHWRFRGTVGSAQAKHRKPKGQPDLNETLGGCDPLRRPIATKLCAAKNLGYAFGYAETKNAPEGASLLGTWRKR